MTRRSRTVNLLLALIAAMLAMTASLALGAAGATAAPLKPLPKSVLILQLQWEQEETSPGVITEGVEAALPPSAYTSVSGQASAWFKEASRGLAPGWSTTFGGSFQIAAPRVLSGLGGLRQPCGDQFFSGLTSRGDQAAAEAGLDLDAHDLVLYVYDEPVCKQMPDPRAEAGLFGSKRVVMQVASVFPQGPQLDDLIHMVGHHVGLEDSGLDPYDVMGVGTGAFSAGNQHALGWLSGDEPEHSNFLDVTASERTFDLFLRPLTGPEDPAVPFPKRAIRVTDGNAVLWLEYRQRVGIDDPSRPGNTETTVPGVIVHREIPNPVPGAAPLSRLLDVTPATPADDAALPLGQTWVNPLGQMQITVTKADQVGALVRIAHQPVSLPSPRVANPDPTRSMIVLNLNWDTNDARSSSGSLETQHLGDTVAEINGRVNTFLRQSAPPGLFRDWQAHPGGTFTIAPPQLPPSGDLDRGRCTAEEGKQVLFSIAQNANRAAAAAGVDVSRFARIVYAYDRVVCGIGGMASLAGKFGEFVWLGTEGIRRSVTQHELGHDLGLLHAEALRCTDAGGRPVTLSSNCTTIEFGDPVDSMGNEANGAFGPINANALGWLNGQFTGLPAGDFSQSFTLAPYMRNPGGAAPRALRLTDGQTTLWLEYRERIGPDAEVIPGLHVHREVASGFVADGRRLPISQQIDMTPATPPADAPTLPEGQTWVNPLGTMKIRFDGAGPQGARVTISSQFVSVPELRGDTITKAKARLGATGLVFGGSTSAVDSTCSFIGLVSDQQPRPGTRVLPGAAVSVTLGTKPKSGCKPL
jgi:PASTA domain